jgi:hypothetical protein
MKRIPVESRCLTAVGYDPRRHILELEFHGGGVYQYPSVPAAVHRALLAAESLGAYFNAQIKNRYPFRVIRAPRREGERQADR